MDSEIVERLTKLGFVKTSHTHIAGEPLVIHAVAGAGKTTLLRSLLELPGVEVFTGGEHDPPNLSGKYIRCAAPPVAGAYNILDEYPAYPNWRSQPWNVLIADNLQYKEPTARAHYTCNRTHRLGQLTVDALCRVGFDITFAGTQTEDYGFQEGHLYTSQFYGQVISLDTQAHKIAVRHGLAPLSALETRGLEFDETTVITTKTSLEEVKDRHMVYVALTRHRRTCHLYTAHFAPSA
uniref:26K protein n=1 Tax=Foxtail mosaic virus TaxID=12179 RepID=B1NLQ1_FXMV|nr:26K protein [Foxtail mosaic virus]